MTERIVKPLPFFVAVKEIALFYVHVFRYILGLVVLGALVQALVSLLMPQNPTVGIAISIFASLVSMFFYAWILYRAESVLMNRPETIKDALHVAKKRFLPLIGVLAVYVVLVVALVLFGFGMQYLGKLLHLTLFLTVISLAITIFIFTLLAFSMPTVILDSMPVFKSFEHSIRLVWGNWWRTFGIITIFIIPIVFLSLLVLLTPFRDIVSLTIYEFIYHIITYPLMVSLILVLYHDLKTRKQMEGFKQIVEHNTTSDK